MDGACEKESEDVSKLNIGFLYFLQLCTLPAKDVQKAHCRSNHVATSRQLTSWSHQFVS